MVRRLAGRVFIAMMSNRRMIIMSVMVSVRRPMLREPEEERGEGEHSGRADGEHSQIRSRLASLSHPRSKTEDEEKGEQRCQNGDAQTQW